MKTMSVSENFLKLLRGMKRLTKVRIGRSSRLLT